MRIEPLSMEEHCAFWGHEWDRHSLTLWYCKRCRESKYEPLVDIEGMVEGPPPEPHDDDPGWLKRAKRMLQPQTGSGTGH